MSEYSDILTQKIQGNKYYDNHLKALELQRIEEEEDKQSLKVKIMA